MESVDEDTISHATSSSDLRHNGTRYKSMTIVPRYIIILFIYICILGAMIYNSTISTLVLAFIFALKICQKKLPIFDS